MRRFMSRLRQPKSFRSCKIPVKPFINRHEDSRGNRSLPALGAAGRRCEAAALHFPRPRPGEFSGYRGFCHIAPVASFRQRGCHRKDAVDFGARRQRLFSYPAQDGTYGALIQLDEHGRGMLDTLSIERRGSFLFVFINGRFITNLQIDKRVSDGKIYIPSGLTAPDIDLMKKTGA